MNFSGKISIGCVCLMLVRLTVAGQQKTKIPVYDFSYLDRKINGWIDSGYYKGHLF